MKILFDLSSTQPVTSSGKDFHGGSEYAKTVFYRLIELLPERINLEVFYDPKRKIDSKLLDLCKENNICVNHCISNLQINNLLADKEYDVFYSALPYLYTDLLISEKCRFIYTIHGLRDLEYPADKYEFYYKKPGLKSLVKHLLKTFFLPIWNLNRYHNRINNYKRLFSITDNQTIITVSNHSKYSLLYFFHRLNNINFKVFYSPAKKYIDKIENNENILKNYSLEPKKYILLVCGDRNEKGAYRACKALHLLIMKNKLPEDFRILVLGVSYRKYYLRLTKNNNKFEFINYVPAEYLECFYKNAHLFLYPTLNEGFGYPPLEAMKYGTLCACSANSAVTEVCGDAVLYFNPYDETEMCIRILQSFDEAIRNEKKDKIIERYNYISKKQNADLDSLVKELINNFTTNDTNIHE